MHFELGTITLSEYDADGFLGVQVDVQGTEPGMTPFEALAPYGFDSRPPDPEDSKACAALFGWQGNQGFAWLATDPVVRTRLGALRRGESRIYGRFGNCVRCHDDGRITLHTTHNNTFDGQSISLELGPTGFVLSAPWGKMRFDATGFHVQDRSGARIDLGPIAGLPAPFNALASYATISAAMVSVEGAATSMGTDGGAKSEAGITALLAYLTALAASAQATPPTPIEIALISQIGKVA